MAVAKPKAVFMHCLPMHRDEEVDDRRGGRAAVDHLRPGRKPAAPAEGAPAAHDVLDEVASAKCK